MKPLAFSLLTSLILSTAALAAPNRAKPIEDDITLQDAELSAAIYQALDVIPGRRAPAGLKKYAKGSTTFIEVENGLRCQRFYPKSYRRHPQPVTSCTLLVGRGWVYVGPDSYRIQGNTPLAMRLFEALNTVDRRHQYMFIRAVRPAGVDEDNGSQLSCEIPTDTGNDLGYQATCRVQDYP